MSRNRVALAFFTAVFALILPLSSMFGAYEGVMAGYASWYGSQGENGLNYNTAMGVPFCPELFEAAAWLPLGTVVEVYCPDTGRRIVVRITDRGPSKKLVRQGRIIDLTREAFRYLSDNHLEKGLIRVYVIVIKKVL